ncbi:DUF1289 domain-containing protein [Shewanella sp. Choline-02u-19]|jgi:predicted Fe-S protein YdhL (DUF1289 family)|uniref:DUF1289 domain-containing protein n=1 Tax=unclassified Shewanella TaxID=196818 RepID=UPI000C34F9AB|nr:MULTISPECIES: DUF1289 domain-containing protein [unclassified Shewanella]PKG74737.1 DUF1289 domain-containing protein [Shewanella sp. GutCb]PKH54197.1 DUF1289 domain-containing protein [Shewanella sp. Bg11-22]PKI28168.1 DUF1289 domain-containing protein [Shewanella sp. Choline-02u-19]
MQSPCVARCGLNEDDYCMGCYRHIDEIVGWGNASDETKARVWTKLEQRKADMLDGENSAILSRAKWLEAEARLKATEDGSI